MKKLLGLGALLVLVVGLVIGWGTIREVGAQIVESFFSDPDRGPFDTGMSKEEFLLKRAEAIGQKRGLAKKGERPDPKIRQNAIRQMEEQEERRENPNVSPVWTEIGPNPIPNGQVNGPFVQAVSGRVTAIAVDPTDPNLVYVGTAQGGLYKSTTGGTSWTQLMNSAMSMAIGAIAIAPSQPGTVYVGTGEPNLSLDSFFGVGLYRITNANTATPVLSGPFNEDFFNIDILSGTAISKIAVHPTDPNTAYVSTTLGFGGIGGVFAAAPPATGLFRLTNATGADPAFTKIDIFPGNPFYLGISDVVMDPADATRVICVTDDTFGFAAPFQRGIYLSTNALGPAPAFTQTWNLPTVDRTELAIINIGPPSAVVYAASGEAGGSVFRSPDGGVTWTTQIINGFCTPQCFYDVAVAVDPINPNNVYLGGSPALIFGRSTDGGLTFTGNASTAIRLHADTHAIAVAPSAPGTIYVGTDGGIWRSTNSGTTWATLNNTTFSATQFMSLAVHPTDPNFTIGGTQDNGTNYYRPSATWTRTDYGDGGYAVVDQSAVNTTTVNMYHTYFNSSTLQGYAFHSSPATAFENWAFRGCNGVGGNGIPCGGSVLFYAPLEQGPGTPNTIYYGADVLYRSSDTGLNHTAVSQILPNPISAIGISPQDDNVRIVGLSDGGIYATTFGSPFLNDIDPGNAVPIAFIARAVVDPNNSNTAYVTLSSFGTVNVWKTTDLNNPVPTWFAASGFGSSVLPQVPVSAFLVDPADSNYLYAGTDIGMYASINGGISWEPFGTGLPRVAVFDIAKTSGNLIRIATHGRGMWQTPAMTCPPPMLTEGFDVVPPPGWFAQNNSSPVGPTGWFQGDNTVFPAHTGIPPASYFAANFDNTAGGANTISNWLLTPVVGLQDGASITFYTRTRASNPVPDRPDRLQVRLSTNGGSTNVGFGPTDVGDFTTLMLDINPTYQTAGVYPETWTQYTVTVAGVPLPTGGRFAFRYFVENSGPGGPNSEYIGIDSFHFNGFCGPLPTATATATFTSTATPTATVTFTPTKTPTVTPTNTATNTPTNTGTPTVTPTASPSGTPSISGTIAYGNAVGSPIPPRFVKNVSVASTVGSPAVGPVITGTPGTYTLTGFGAGSYTIKPTKPGGANGAITSNDAARVAQGVVSAPGFISQNQRFAADTSGNGGITSNDAALIARFAAGLTGTGNTGQWKFFVTGAPSPLPTVPQAYDDSRTYASVTGNLTGEDFVGILVGEASGNWNPVTHPRTVNSGQWTVESQDGGKATPITVTVQDVVTAANMEIVIPVSVEGVKGKEIISYEFDLIYDPAMIQPLENPVDVSGTVSRGLMVVVNPNDPCLLRVVVYGPMPIDENGVLLNLRFTAVGKAGAVSPLTFERIMFNEGEPQVMMTNGQVELI